MAEKLCCENVIKKARELTENSAKTIHLIKVGPPQFKYYGSVKQEDLAVLMNRHSCTKKLESSDFPLQTVLFCFIQKHVPSHFYQNLYGHNVLCYAAALCK